MKRNSLIALVMCIGSVASADTTALRLLNAIREDANLGALKVSPKLEAAALIHANDMAENNFFAHTGSDGSNVGARVTRTGYRWCIVAENIAKGQSSLAEVLTAWENSPPHRENIERPEVTDFAVVGSPGDYWVMVLAAQDC